MQDLADAGKLVSDGWAFFNSINTEMATGGNQEGKPPLESGASQNDMDYLHVINWRKAEELVKAGKTETIAGMRVIPLQTCRSPRACWHFVPEPKSPHGVDVTPDGDDIVVGGKLDTHATVLRLQQDQGADRGQAVRGQGPVRRAHPAVQGRDPRPGRDRPGPLHTQFDDKGFAYTSVFIETVVAKWSLKDLKVVEKMPTHYNIGHLVAAEGDTSARRQVPHRHEQVGARPLQRRSGRCCRRTSS
jgi:nitrous-oxide reductase